MGRIEKSNSVEVGITRKNIQANPDSNSLPCGSGYPTENSDFPFGIILGVSIVIFIVTIGLVRIFKIGC
jgi:hypothetical protein